MKKTLTIVTCVGIPIALLIVLISGVETTEFKKEHGRIDMNHESSPCEMLADQMIQAKNDVKQYVLNPNQFNSDSRSMLEWEASRDDPTLFRRPA